MSPSVVDTARALATRAHTGQRYGAAPYTVHLAQAVAVLHRHGVTDAKLVAATWLHDTLEDTSVSRDTLVAAVGEPITALVDAVTDGPGAHRAERKARPYRMIPQTPGAVLVKLADRVANVEASVGVRPTKLAKYRAEHATFREKLHAADDRRAAALWATLDALLET